MRALPLLLALGLLVPAAGLGLAGLPAPAAPGLLCDPACNVRVSPGTAPVSRPAFALDPRDPDHVLAAANDYGVAGVPACTEAGVWVSAFESFDGGRTWTREPVPGFPGDAPGLGSVLEPFECSNAPSVAFDSKGRALVAARGFAEDDAVNLGTLQNGVYVAQRVGPSWVLVSLVTAGASFYAVHEQPNVAVDPGDGVAYVGWSAAGIPVMSRSIDGLVWGPPVLALWADEDGTPHMPPVHFGGSVKMAIGSKAMQDDGSHDLFFTFFDGLDIWEALSLDHGSGWEHVVRVAKVDLGADADHGLELVPSTAVYFPDPNPQNLQILYMAWADARFGDTDVVLTRDRDNGHLPFDFTVRVSDDTNGAQQFGPVIAVGADGSVHAAWYDDRNVAATGLTDVYYSVSRDDGQTWSPNLRVTTQGFDPYLSQDHLGRWDLGQVAIAVDPQGVAHVLWTDTRDGHAAVYGARVQP